MPFNSFPQPKPDSGGGNNIKSYQDGIASIPASATSVTVTITAVDVTKVAVRISTPAINAQANMNTVGYTVVNSTTIQFFVNAIPTSGVSVYWEVIEFANVKSLQSGTRTGNGNSTFSTVNPDKCLLFVAMMNTSTTNAGVQYLYGYQISSATSITFQGSGTMTYYWTIVEFL